MGNVILINIYRLKLEIKFLEIKNVQQWFKILHYSVSIWVLWGKRNSEMNAFYL